MFSTSRQISIWLHTRTTQQSRQLRTHGQFFWMHLSSLGFLWLSHHRGGGGRIVNLPQAKRNHSDLFPLERDGDCLVSGLRGPNPPHKPLCAALLAVGTTQQPLQPRQQCSWAGPLQAAQCVVLAWKGAVCPSWVEGAAPCPWHPRRSAPCWCPASPPLLPSAS